MPVYAFAPKSDNRPTHGDYAVRLGDTLQSILQQNQQKAALEKQEALKQQYANASPIEKQKILDQMSPELGIKYAHQQAQEAFNQQKLLQQEQKNSQLQELLSSIQQRAQGGGRGVTPENIAPEIPGITPMKGQPAPTQTPSEIAAVNQPQQRAQQGLNIRPEEIVAASALNPAVGRALGDTAKIAQRQEQFEYGKEQDIRKETQKYVDNVLDKFQGAKTSEAILGQMDALASKGGLTTPLMYNLLGKLGLPLGVLNNPNAEEFEKDTNFLTRDIQKFYGARILASEFQNFLKQLPSLSNSEEGRKRIIRNLQKVLLPATFEYKAYKEVLKENGGKRPPNLREQVMDKMEPLLEKWGDELKADINKTDPTKVPEGTLVVIAPDGRRVAVPKEHLAEALAQGGKVE